MIDTKLSNITPSYLFNTVKSILRASNWDFDSIGRLKDMSWPEICETLELGSKIRKAFRPNEGRVIAHLVVNSLVAENDQALKDELEIQRDLEIAQGRRV